MTLQAGLYKKLDLFLVNFSQGKQKEDMEDMEQKKEILIGKNIKRIRKEKGLTQKKLGELCGINEANIRKYELGKANPKIETIEKIAKALETTADELRGIKRDIAYNVDEIVEVLNRYKAQQLENETLSYNGRWIACKVIEECIKIVKTGGAIHRR